MVVMKATQAQFKVKGGIHPAYHKELARDNAIDSMPISDLLSVSIMKSFDPMATPSSQ